MGSSERHVGGELPQNVARHLVQAGHQPAGGAAGKAAADPRGGPPSHLGVVPGGLAEGAGVVRALGGPQVGGGGAGRCAEGEVLAYRGGGRQWKQGVSVCTLLEMARQGLAAQPAPSKPLTVPAVAVGEDTVFAPALGLGGEGV